MDEAELQATHAQLAVEVEALRREVDRLSRVRSGGGPRGFWRGVAVGAGLLVVLMAAGLLFALGELFAHFPGG